jgi:DNA-binding GntR family transcriptional regulator
MPFNGLAGRRGRLNPTQRVQRYLIDAIVSGEFKPRQRIIEADLAHELGCSRGPVREAILRLVGHGLLVTLPRRGTFVSDSLSESMEVTYRIRGKLEALCVWYFRQRMTEKDQTALEGQLKKLRKASRTRNPDAFLEADMQFHRLIWNLSGQPQLEETLGRLMNPFIITEARASIARTDLESLYKLHEDYYRLIVKAPLSQIEKQVEKHFLADYKSELASS